MSSEIERLRAERDALASALEEAREALEPLTCGCDGLIGSTDCSNGLGYCEAETARRRALSDRIAHHAERVRLRDAVVEAARNFVNTPEGTSALFRVFSQMKDALADLDAHERKEQAGG